MVVDLAFYALHWALHSRRAYDALHRRHHEHRSPSVWTNYHFTVPDLILEGFAPFGAALLLMQAQPPRAAVKSLSRDPAYFIWNVTKGICRVVRERLRRSRLPAS